MKFALIFLSTLVVVSHQQFKHPRGLIWASPYVQQYYKQSFYYGPDEESDIRPLRRQYRPSIPIAYLPLNEDFSDEQQDESDGISQSRFKGFEKSSNGGRLFYSSTINNPFYKTATFTITSTVTTVGSVVICVPSNNLAAVPAPTCAGRRKREAEDDSGSQFLPIAPSKTLELIPTAVPLVSGDQQNLDGSLSTDTVEMNNNSREKRLFGSGVAASTTLTSYSFVGTALTSTVLLDPTGMKLAACLPSGYVVC